MPFFVCCAQCALFIFGFVWLDYRCFIEANIEKKEKAKCFWRKFVVSQVKSALLLFKESLYLRLLHVAETVFVDHFAVVQKDDGREVPVDDCQ